MNNTKQIDKEAIEKAVREIIIALGENPEREGLIETPKRVAKAYAEIFDGINYTNEEIAKMYDKGFTDEDFLDEDGAMPTQFGEFVLVKNIRCYSMCEHHCLPMTLDISIAYIPGKKVVGLSKMPRVAKKVCQRMQLQERIGRDIAEILTIMSESEDVAVIVKGSHMCVSMRGVQDTSSVTHTAYFGGKFKDNYYLRKEMMDCVNAE